MSKMTTVPTPSPPPSASSAKCSAPDVKLRSGIDNPDDLVRLAVAALARDAAIVLTEGRSPAAHCDTAVGFDVDCDCTIAIALIKGSGPPA